MARLGPSEGSQPQPSKETVTVELPKVTHCWYSAVRVYLFTADLTKFEARIPENQRTVADHVTWNPPLCTTGAADACWSGTAVAQYPVDTPRNCTNIRSFPWTLLPVRHSPIRIIPTASHWRISTCPMSMRCICR
jgi:hypothetical protein